jgi:hypothetical protein
LILLFPQQKKEKKARPREEDYRPLKYKVMTM